MLATYLTEPVELKVSTHVETIQFIIASVMTEAMVLGLLWWRKWNPSINWDRIR